MWSREYIWPVLFFDEMDQPNVCALVNDIWMLIQRSLIDLALTHVQGETSMEEWLHVQDVNSILLSMRRINILGGKARHGQDIFISKIDEWDWLLKKVVRTVPSEYDTSSLLDELSAFKRSLSIFVYASAWIWSS